MGSMGTEPRLKITNRDEPPPAGEHGEDRLPPLTSAPKTLSVPKAGKEYFDLGRNASYDAAKRGDLPVIRIGSRLRVPVAALERMLADAGRKHD